MPQGQSICSHAPLQRELLGELPSSFPRRLSVSRHSQTFRATRTEVVADATEKQLLQSEALLHLPGHRTKRTHVLRDLSTRMGDIRRIVNSVRKQCRKKHGFCGGTWKQYSETQKVKAIQLWTVSPFHLAETIFSPVFC